MQKDIKKINLKLYDVIYTSGALMKRSMVHLSVFQIMNILMNIGLVFIFSAINGLAPSVMGVLEIAVLFLFNITYYAGTWSYFEEGVARDKFKLDDLAGGFKKVKNISLYAIIILVLFLPLILLVYYTIPFEVFQNPDYLNNEENLQAFAQAHGNKIFIYFILAVLINIFTYYAVPFIVVKEMNAFDAVKTSIQLALKNFIRLFSILFIIIFASFLVISLLTGLVGGNQILLYLVQVVYFVFLQCVFYAIYYHTMLKLTEEEV